VVFDIVLGAPLVLFTLLGLRDGLVRKLVSIAAILVGLILGQLFMHDAGEFLTRTIAIPPREGPSMGFFAIFALITLSTGLLYRIVSGNYKIGGVADKILGAVLGFVQGALLASSLLLILAMQGLPSRSTVQNSGLYKPLVNIAPQLLDLGSSIGPETQRHLENLADPKKVIEGKVSKKLEAETRKKADEVNKQMQEARKKLDKAK
jgi:uncharacterized membrane protein required for colicin V production